VSDSSPKPVLPSALEGVYAYHQRTKHAFERYAAGPGSLDWATQPNPFRTFEGAPRVRLPLSLARASIGYAALFEAGGNDPAEPGLDALGLLLELAFGLSAWKSYGGERWVLRCNPSSGNLHPTEAYLITAGQPELPGGIYHYRSYDHALERRCLAELPLSGFLIALSAVHWREAWKYGERAYRYCQHDAGHAVGTLSYAAAVLGWSVQLLMDWGDRDIAALLGLDRAGDFAGAEPEAPELVCWVGPAGSELPAGCIDRLVGTANRGSWSGQANRLSAGHRQEWTAIDAVHAAAAKPRTEPMSPAPSTVPTPEPMACRSRMPAVEVIRQRRSAQAFDGVTALPVEAFYRMLDACLPRPGRPPFSGWPWPPRVHLMLFVHRVQSLAPGLYVFWRGNADVAALRTLFKPEFEWLPAGPDGFPLFRLLAGDAREVAKVLSCHQAIAADSAFSLGMLAEFDDGLRGGAWVYRRLFWESGLIGQALYLEAEAAGVRGTGIGCFFDDPVHALLGLSDTRLQSLCHFTVGEPLTDARLQTLPAYAHLGWPGTEPG